MSTIQVGDLTVNRLGFGAMRACRTSRSPSWTRRGASPAQVARAWLLAKSPVMLPIPGTGNLRHLEENAAAARLRLSAADLAALG